MDFSKIGDTLAAVAPTIAGLLGGPLASMGVQTLEQVFGLEAGTGQKDPQKVIEAVAGMSPDTAIKLAQIDADLKSKLVQAGIDYETIAAGDRASARQRQVQVKDSTPAVLAYLVTAGFFGLLAFMATNELPPNSKDMLNIMVGTLGTAWVAIISYFFGSSMGSAKKDETITALSK